MREKRLFFFEEKCFERKSQSKGTSLKCPSCGLLLKVSKMWVEIGRDVVAVLNLGDGRYLTSRGLMQLAPMPPLLR
jgi:ssDNA-binding Zn-finger/Zn-ribbon topoisomerase 1